MASDFNRHHWTFEQARPEDRLCGLGLICGALGAASVAEVQASLPPEHELWVARRGQELGAAIAAYPQAGRSGYVLPPGLARGAEVSVGSELLRTMLGDLRKRGIVWCQSLLESETGTLAGNILRESGFILATRLLYLVSPSSAAPDQEPHSSLSFLSLSTGDDERLRGLIERTYIETQDCPDVGSWRDTSDVLAGYRATGEYDPSRWLLVQREGEDVGCLLLTEHPAQRQWELVYMGVVPEARGQGYGIEVVRYGQWRARQAGSEQLVLAVDAMNERALEVYAACGFVAWAERSVWVCHLDGTPR